MNEADSNPLRLQYRQKGLITAACTTLGHPALAERAYFFFCTAHAEHEFSFGRFATPWAAGAIWLAADEASEIINPITLSDACDAPLQDAKKRKFEMRRYSTLAFNDARQASLAPDVVNVICTFLASLANGQVVGDNSATESRALPVLPPKNKTFLKEATKQQALRKVQSLASTLASRFVNNSKITGEAPFACACIIIAMEAVTRRVVPHLSSIIDSLKTVCPGASSYTFAERYRELLRWMRTVFCTLPWIDEAEKADLLEEDASSSRRTPALEALYPSASQITNHSLNKKRKISTKSKAGKRKSDLTPYYEQIINYKGSEMLTEEIGAGSQERAAKTNATGEVTADPLLDPTLVHAGRSLPDTWRVKEVRLSEFVKGKDCVRPREQIVEAAAAALAGAKSQAAHDDNVQHYMRLLLTGQDIATLKTSEDVAHAPVASLVKNASLNQVAAHRAKLSRMLLDIGNPDDILDDDLFMDGEMEGYLRSREERVAYTNQLQQSGRLQEMDDALLRSERNNDVVKERKERQRLRRAAQETAEISKAGTQSQKRKRDEDANDWQNILFGIERDIIEPVSLFFSLTAGHPIGH